MKKIVNIAYSLCKDIKIYLIWILALVFSILEFFIAKGIINLEQNFILKNIILLIILTLVLALINYYLNKITYLKQKQYKQKIDTNIIISLSKIYYKKIEDGLDGEIITLLISDSDTISNAYVVDLTKIIVGIFSFVSAVIFGIFTSVPLTIFSLLLCPLSILIFKYIANKVEKAWEARQESLDESQEILQEIFINRFLIRIFKSENFAIKLLKEKYGVFTTNNYENARLQWLLYTLTILSGLLFDTLTLMFSFYLILSNRLSIGAFIAFSILTKNYTWIFYELPNYLIKIKTAEVSFNRINEFIVLNSENIPFNEEVNNLKLENISFSYDNETEIIKNINLEINSKKDKLIISGESGSGKTTLLKILLGLYKPSKGNFYINNKKVINIPKNIFSYVPQQIELFPFTIKENILLGRNVSADKLNRIIEKVGLKNTILEKGLDHVINLTDNIDLSSGQIQKIAIARALVEEKILILDEPFANTDLESENTLSKFLEDLDIPVILISHRDTNFFKKARILSLN